MQAVVELPALKTKIKGKSYLRNCSVTSVRETEGYNKIFWFYRFDERANASNVSLRNSSWWTI